MLLVSNYIKNPSLALLGIIQRLNFLFPDKMYLKLMYRLRMGKRLDLKDPQTFSEKLQWLKLYNRKPEYTTMVDKIEAKEYVTKLIGAEFIIPTLGVWSKPEDIDWDMLPEQFVLKTNHGGGNTGVVVCRDKSKLDKQKAVGKLTKSLKTDIYKTLREWPYKNIEKKVFAEMFLENKGCTDLVDYKFFCFDGIPKVLLVANNRTTTHNFNYFDMDFNPIDLSFSKDGAPLDCSCIKKPNSFDLMKEIAVSLSKNLPHVRVDLYCVEEKIYFGELTFFDSSGFDSLSPDKWNKRFGDWIVLSDIKKR